MVCVLLQHLPGEESLIKKPGLVGGHITPLKASLSRWLIVGVWGGAGTVQPDFEMHARVRRQDTSWALGQTLTVFLASIFRERWIVCGRVG